MNKEMQKLLKAINDKKNEVKSLVAEGKLDKAKTAKEELKTLQEKFDLLFDLDEEEHEEIEDKVAAGKAKTISGGKADKKNLVKSFVNIIKAGFFHREPDEDDVKVYKDALTSDATPDDDGESGIGITIPDDIRTDIIELRRSDDNLEQYVNVEGVTTKTGTCTKCDQYKNRGEAYKTEEQRYSEEQDRIDKETAKKLREREDEERMKNLPSETQENGQKVHHIKLGASFFGEVERGEKTFELCKNDRDYKKGDILEMMEFKDGKNTGRTVRVLVTYILTEFAGLEEGYCIMATCLLNENGEPLERADIKQICAEIRANGDGYIEGGDEYIMIDNAVGIIEGGGIE